MLGKSILCKKLTKKKWNQSTFVIGVYGLHRYAGVSHLCILMAIFLSEICGRSVAVIEVSGKDDLRKLANRYQVKPHDSKSTKDFILKKILFISQACECSVGIYRNSKFEFCILDLGGNYKKAATELLRCDLKIVIGNSAPWQEEAWDGLTELFRGIKDLSTWCIFRNLTTDRLVVKKKQLGRVFSIGFEPNLLHPSKTTIKIFQKVLQIK